MAKEKYKPSGSPTSAKADFISDAQYVARAFEAGIITNAQAGKVAEALFEVFSLYSDEDVVNGLMKPESVSDVEALEEEGVVNEKNLGQFVKICNDLFKLANDSEIGARIHLSPEVVNDFDIKTAARARCMGLSKLLDTLCDIVNQEIMYRKPDISVSTRSGFKAEPLGDSGRDGSGGVPVG